MEHPLDAPELADPAKAALIDGIFRLNQLALTGLSGWSALDQAQGFLSPNQAHQRDILLMLRTIVQQLGQEASTCDLRGQAAARGLELLKASVDERRLSVAKGSLEDEALHAAELLMTAWRLPR